MSFLSSSLELIKGKSAGLIMLSRGVKWRTEKDVYLWDLGGIDVGGIDCASVGCRTTFSLDGDDRWMLMLVMN